MDSISLDKLNKLEELLGEAREELVKNCPRCSAQSANKGNPAGRCRKHLNKLKTAKKTPGHWQRAQTKADDSLRRQDGKNGTAHYKSKGRGTRKEIVNKIQHAEKKTGQKLSPDRKSNDKGYTSSNVRAIPEHLNVGRHTVNPKKLRAWQKRLKKSDTSYEELQTFLLAKASEIDNQELITLLQKSHPNELANFINNEDVAEPDSLDLFIGTYLDKYAPLEKGADTAKFVRHEDKYILPITLKNEVINLVSSNMQTDYVEPDTTFNVMKSIYFDSPNLDMVNQHLSKADRRFKLRTREYGPNGDMAKASDVFLEIKAKNSGVSDKFRFRISQKSFESLQKGNPILMDDVAKMNTHIPRFELIKRVEDVNEALAKFSLRPSAEVVYSREAFCSSDHSVRVTFDHNLTYRSLNTSLSKVASMSEADKLTSAYDPAHHFILEVKHQGAVPTWLTSTLASLGAPQVSFSKYCFAVLKK